jgi:hypothetical protein
MYPSAHEIQNDRNCWLHQDSNCVEYNIQPNTKNDTSAQMYDVNKTIYIPSSDLVFRLPNELS